MLKSCFVSLWLGNWAQCRQMAFIHYGALASDEEVFICIEKDVQLLSFLLDWTTFFWNWGIQAGRADVLGTSNLGPLVLAGLTLRFIERFALLGRLRGNILFGWPLWRRDRRKAPPLFS